MNRGYVLSLDAIIAILLLFVIFIGFASFEYSKIFSGERLEHFHYVAENCIEVLNKNGILEEIVFYWSENSTIANEMAEIYLDKILPSNVGYNLKINGESICNNTRISEDEASSMTTATRIISGYKKGRPVNEFVARAWLLYNDTTLNKTYTIANVSYGNSFKAVNGSNWTIEYKTGGGSNTVALCVPPDCSGDDIHTYTSIKHEHPGTDDAIDDAIYRLLDNLDTDNDGIIDMIDGKEFNSARMRFKTRSVSVKTLLDTVIVKLTIWGK